ncbi:MAG TPA: hypothetical protein VGM50_01600 [Gemmatimonadaceae bacterium]
MRRRLIGTVVMSILASSALHAASAQTSTKPSPSIPPAVTPCAGATERHQFDFWIGEWDVTTPDGTPQGKSSVQSMAGGCGLLENWTALNGMTGKSLNAFNPLEKHWQQYWVGQGGFVTEYRDSEVHDKSIAFYTRAPGRTGRLTFTPLDDGTVRQFSELSTDGEKTWTVQYDYRYHRAK